MLSQSHIITENTPPIPHMSLIPRDLKRIQLDHSCLVIAQLKANINTKNGQLKNFHPTGKHSLQTEGCNTLPKTSLPAPGLSTSGEES